MTSTSDLKVGEWVTWTEEAHEKGKTIKGITAGQVIDFVQLQGRKGVSTLAVVQWIPKTTPDATAARWIKPLSVVDRQ